MSNERLNEPQFAVTMGTGIVAVLFHTFSELYPSYHRSLRALSIAFFILNIIIFSTMLMISVLRYTLYPAIWILKMGWLDTIRLVGHVVARRRTQRCLLPLATFPDVS